MSSCTETTDAAIGTSSSVLNLSAVSAVFCFSSTVPRFVVEEHLVTGLFDRYVFRLLLRNSLST